MNYYATYAEVRDSQKLTDYQVAKGTGIAPSTISDWKLGKSVPKVDKLMAIAEFLGISLDLLCGVGHES